MSGREEYLGDGLYASFDGLETMKSSWSNRRERLEHHRAR